MDRRSLLRTLAVVGVGAPLGARCTPSRGSGESIPPGWPGPPAIDADRNYRLPDWFDTARVQAHTRLPLGWVDEPTFFEATGWFRSMGARVFTRHIKSADEGAWWESATGIQAPESRGRDLARRIIDEAHEAGCRIIVYYRHQEDAHMAAQNPDWVCRDPRGRPLTTERGTYLCLNSPYVDHVETRLSELADMGADGFFFDETHMPPVGCWCPYCRERFRAETGRALGDDYDPIYQAQRDFNNHTVTRAVRRWRATLHDLNPELVLVVSAYRWITTAGRHLEGGLMRISDSVKTELTLPAATSRHSPFGLRQRMDSRERDVQLALGYTMARDAADGRPPLVWIHGRLSEAALTSATCGVLAHGGVSSIDIPEAMMAHPLYERPFELWERVAPHLGGARPFRWAAVHFPERARNRYYADPPEAWDRILDPLYVAYRILLRARAPVGVVTDHQLENGDLEGYRLLVLPESGELSAGMTAAVDSFVETGGTVLSPANGWTRDLARLAAEAPIRSLGGPEALHAVPHVSPAADRILVALVDDFSWVVTGQAYRPAFGWVPPQEDGPNPAVRDIEIRIRGIEIRDTPLDAVTGETLDVRAVEGGHVVEVPLVDPFALVVLEAA